MKEQAGVRNVEDPRRKKEEEGAKDGRVLEYHQSDRPDNGVARSGNAVALFAGLSVFLPVAVGVVGTLLPDRAGRLCADVANLCLLGDLVLVIPALLCAAAVRLYAYVGWLSFTPGRTRLFTVYSACAAPAAFAVLFLWPAESALECVFPELGQGRGNYFGLIAIWLPLHFMICLPATWWLFRLVLARAALIAGTMSAIYLVWLMVFFVVVLP